MSDSVSRFYADFCPSDTCLALIFSTGSCQGEGRSSTTRASDKRWGIRQVSLCSAHAPWSAHAQRFKIIAWFLCFVARAEKQAFLDSELENNQEMDKKIGFAERHAAKLRIDLQDHETTRTQLQDEVVDIFFGVKLRVQETLRERRECFLVSARKLND